MNDSLVESLKEYLKELLNSYQSPLVKGFKVIHDSVWGTNIFKDYEIALIDSPLIQRLRGIHQTSLAYYTYPSALHSRFEHTLGVTVLAARIARQLNEIDPTSLNTLELAEIRIAALLHDCGHGVFSHVSENIYKSHPWLDQLLRDIEYSSSKSKPHEIISFLIVQSDEFKNFFEKEIVRKYPNPILNHVNLDRVANLILGKSSPEKKYLGDIINGPFDADKLDYIIRDSYFTGLKLVVDVDRLLYGLKIMKIGNDLRIVINYTSVNAVEQILFSKMMLYTSLYHHRKVRAADSELYTFVEYVGDNYERIEKESNIKLLDPIDFLKYNDFDFLNIRLYKDDYLKGKVEDIRNRKLFKCALVISPKTIEGRGVQKFISLQRRKEQFSILRTFREKIIKELPPERRCNVYDVFIDLPEQPSLREATQTYIIDMDNNYSLLNQYFPTDDWLTAYYANKWKGYVFCKEGFERDINKAAIKVFEDSLRVKFNLLATKQAKLNESFSTN